MAAVNLILKNGNVPSSPLNVGILTVAEFVVEALKGIRLITFYN